MLIFDCIMWDNIYQFLKTGKNLILGFSLQNWYKEMKGKIKVSFSLSMYFDIFLALEARWENKFRE